MAVKSSTRRVGRPRNATASAHQAILTAVYDLLQQTTVRDLTIEAVAARAGVGKPTIYKWWSTKAGLVLAMFRERVVPQLEAPAARSLEESVRIKVDGLIEAFNGFFGKVMAELIAEGQSQPELLRALNDGYVKPRRASTVADIRAAQLAGEFPSHIDPELVVDAVFGSIYFQMLLRVRPLTREYGQALVDQVFRSLSAGAPPPKRGARRSSARDRSRLAK